MLGKVGCFFGFHDADEWKYTAEGKCEQDATCKRPECRKHITRTNHTWGTKTRSEQSCTYYSTCLRCKETKTENTAHNWSEWTYKSSDKCFQTRTCHRCRQTDSQLEHMWDVWVHESPTSCLQVRFCRRCNNKETGKVIHKWGIQQNGVQICLHCGEAQRV